MRYQTTIRATHATIRQIAESAPRGQWIELDGARGRVAGVRNGTIWIAWGGTARKRFGLFCQAFRTR